MELCEEEPAAVRQSLNRPVTTPHPNCILSIGTQRLPAILADEQDGGLRILIQGSPSFWVEDSGVLQMLEAEIAVRVSSIVRLERDEDDDPSCMPAFCIGLAKLGQVVGDLQTPAAPIPLQESRPNIPSPPPTRNQPWVTVGGLIAFVLIVTPLAMVAVTWHLHARSVVPQNADTVPPDAPLPSQMADDQSAIPSLAIETLLLPGVEPFLKPEVAKALALTPLQMEALGRLDKTTQEALQDLGKYWESANRLEVARRRYMLLDAARQEAFYLLTDQQRQQWESITSHLLVNQNHDE